MHTLSNYAACLLLSLTAFRVQGQTPFTLKLPPGEHAVGLRVVLQYDFSRTYRAAFDAAGRPYLGERARPIQTLIWYPAERGNNGKLKFGDYLDLFATEEDFAPLPEVAAKIVAGGRKGYDADPDSPMQAVRDAALAAGRYPVVVYAPSLSASAFENADLCEYLASRGYVVVASPDMGTHARGMSIDLEGAETQARDISFLIGFARTLPDADLSAVAVAGFSWGGISNLLAAALDNRVKVLVSLDGSARYYPKLTEEAKYVVPESLTIPVLFFTQQNRSLEELSGTPAMSRSVLLRLTHCDLTIVRMDAMSHRHFASLFNRSPKIWNDTPREDYSSEEVSTSYGWVARYTERFLAARLKGDAAAAGFIAATPAKNGVPPHVVKIDFRPAQGPPLTFDGLVSELSAKGFEHTSEVYEAMRAKDKNFKIEEDKINTWGYGLLELNCVPQAIEVFKLNVSLYPDAWNTYDSLADGYRVNGQKDLAIKFYKKAIGMNPKDVNGVARLKDLR